VQITSVAVGNPNLAPEKADTVTLGAVFRPSFVDGLQMSVDYYNVNVDDAIGQLGFQRIVDDCFRNIDPALCAYVERDAASQVIGRVKNPYLNVAKTTVKGVDYEAQYTLRPDFLGSQPETLTFRAFASNILKRSNQSSDTATVNRFDGGFTGGVLYPKWKGTASLTYTFGKWDAQLTEEWISKSKIDTTWIDTAAFAAGDRVVNGVTKTLPDVDDNWLRTTSTPMPASAIATKTAAGHAWDLSFYVANLLDKHPMVIPATTRGRDRRR
jgi:outer membrane receptor protein involved in Fe transport